MLTRSVNILRTSLVNTDVANRLLELLSGKKEDNDLFVDREEVRIGAVAVVTNLLVEFSPLRIVSLKLFSFFRRFADQYLYTRS